MIEHTSKYDGSSSDQAKGCDSFKPKKLMADAQKSYLKSDDKRKVDLGVFQEYEDRVQRLSGEHL
jgi:hypothetical protein